MKHHPNLSAESFDGGVVTSFKRLSEKDAIAVFEELLAADLSQARHTFFLGLGGRPVSSALEQKKGCSPLPHLRLLLLLSLPA